jgi:cytochrome c oxidase subunit 2
MPVNKSILALAVLGMCLTGRAVATAEEATAGAHEIKMTAKNYDFEPSVLTVKQGEKVRLIITATDRDHGIKLDAFGIDQVLKRNDPAIVEFTAHKVGTFKFKCSVYCGRGHGKMKGTLVVEAP